MGSELVYDDGRVRASVMHRGYKGAVSRLFDALSRQDAEQAFDGLFEALNWAAAIDDLVGEIWQPDGKREGREWRGWVTNGHLMDGVRFIRNRVHHQWADAIRYDAVESRVLPFLVGGAWVWKPLGELPNPDARYRDLRGEEAYRQLLAADDRVAFTLSDLDEVFGFVVRLLEPSSPAIDATVIDSG